MTRDDAAPIRGSPRPHDPSFVPSRIGATALAALTLLTALWYATLVGAIIALGCAIAGSLLLAVAAVALRDDDPHRVALGSLAGVVAPALVLYGVSRPLSPSPSSPPPVGTAALVAVLALAVFAASATVPAAVGYRRLWTAANALGRSLVPPSVLLIAEVGVAAVALAPGVGRALDAAGDALGSLLLPSGSVAVGSFLIVTGAAQVATRRAVRRLPLAALAPDARRRGVREAGERVVHACRFGPLSLVCGLLVGAFEVAGSLPLAYRALPSPVRGALVALTTAPAIRWPSLAWLALALTVIVVARAIREASRLRPAGLVGALAPMTGGAVATAGFLAVGGASLVERLDRTPVAGDFAAFVAAMFGGPTLALMAAFLALSAAYGLVVALPLLAGLLAVPDRVAGPALASGALLVAAALVAAVHGETLALFVGVAVAMLVWDAGEFATSLAEDLGGARTLRPPEFVHGAASAAVAVVSVVAAATLTALIGGGGGETSSSVLPVALVGLALLVAALRGSLRGD
ncbi:hypothetical protein ACFQPA_02740 [Halomarina halobia]|uniref:Uncharacterized protein n=1 Tax=Halomarina halobia TaxID=3033386 RepID=A0ABD6A4L7_9EURY|nr:hypothetical protein [Halomarina sp. PSR21]